jgi:hypothetical protein
MRSITVDLALDFMTPSLKERLNERLRAPGEQLMPHFLAVYLGIEYSQSLTVLAVLKARGICRNRLLIYHNCTPGVPVGSVPYGAGFPQLPWACPLCERTLTSYEELRFDLEAIIVEPVEITWR